MSIILELCDWVNETLGVNIAKIEQTCSGAMACQLFDIMHPGQVAMNKVNWAAKQDFEYISNYKVLQTAFTKHHVDKVIRYHCMFAIYSFVNKVFHSSVY